MRSLDEGMRYSTAEGFYNTVCELFKWDSMEQDYDSAATTLKASSDERFWEELLSILTTAVAWYPDPFAKLVTRALKPSTIDLSPFLYSFNTNNNSTALCAVCRLVHQLPSSILCFVQLTILTRLFIKRSCIYGLTLCLRLSLCLKQALHAKE